jgi:formimidoylglutamate deiminase
MPEGNGCSVHCPLVLLEQGWQTQVRLQLDAGGFITQLVHGPAQEGDQRLSGPVIPGMPNLHSHGFQRLIAGLTGRRAGGRDSFWTWREAMYRMAMRIDPDQLERCMAGVYLEMLRSGYTSCAEFHYLHHAPDGSPYANPAEMSERVLAAAVRSGVALTHLPVLYSRAGFAADTTLPEQRRFRNELEAFLGIVAKCEQVAATEPLASVGIAPHSLRAVRTQHWQDLLIAAGPDRPVHIHIAEQPREVEECRAVLGQAPVQWLLDHVPVDHNWCLVHATHMDEAERLAAAGCGAVAGLCPTTEADLGDGIFDADAWLAAGGSFGIGSDSNLRISPAEELRALEFSQRLVTGQRNVMAQGGNSCGRSLYAGAARGGAQALGQPVGSLQVGRRADLLELDPQHPMLNSLGDDDLLDSWLFAGDQTMLRSVWVAGKKVIDRGCHAHQQDIEAGFHRVLGELRG